MVDTAVQAFDDHAQNYADQWGADPVAVQMRAEVHRTLSLVLRSNSKVLDLGCGIGLDSAWLKEQGHRVLAVDRSAEMVAQARAMVPGLEVIHGSVESVLASLEGEPFDAAVLDFGVVNCLDLDRLVKGLSRCIRPGGAVFVIPMPRVAPAWILGALFRGRFGAAWERTRAHVQVDVEGVLVDTRYWSSGELVEAFGPGFVLQTQRSLGLSLPPPGSRRGSQLSPRQLALERRLGRLPVLRRMGDHLLMNFRRELPRAASRGLIEKVQRRLETQQARSSGRIKVLRTLILELTSACQSRCMGCSHRGSPGGEALDLDRVKALIAEAELMGAEEVLLTGGEPLLRPDIREILEAGRQSSLRVVLLSNGLAVARHASLLARCCDGLVLSLDAADFELYREIRGVDGLRAVEQGIEALRRLNPNLPITGRCTVTARNAHALREIALHAMALGMSELSYLAADHQTEHAFGRDGSVELEPPDPRVLAAQIEALWQDPGPPFISNSRDSLDRIVAHARAACGEGHTHSPRCDAPWTSVVVEPDLSIRPCFFLEQQGNVRMGLAAGLERGTERRRTLRIDQEAACARCVCWARLG
jgi:MoaA/NifB/PqqE/SkfB family radical SAM enzyme/SAM-dependent methyltransferase